MLGIRSIHDTDSLKGHFNIQWGVTVRKISRSLEAARLLKFSHRLQLDRRFGMSNVGAIFFNKIQMSRLRDFGEPFVKASPRILCLLTSYNGPKASIRYRPTSGPSWRIYSHLWDTDTAKTFCWKHAIICQNRTGIGSMLTASSWFRSGSGTLWHIR